MMSRRAVAMRRERHSVLSVGSMESLESGGMREVVGANGALEASVAVGRRKEVSADGTDFVR